MSDQSSTKNCLIFLNTWSKVEEGLRFLNKMSKLNCVAANPKPIERQNVYTCLKVFCEETINDFKYHPGMQCDNVDCTVIFLSKMVKFWKIVNVKSPFEGIQLKDFLRDPISLPEDMCLSELLELADMVGNLKSQHGKRIRCLIKDTSTSFEHSCKGLVELVKHLLQTSHSYVLLGCILFSPSKYIPNR